MTAQTLLNLVLAWGLQTSLLYLMDAVADCDYWHKFNIIGGLALAVLCVRHC